jgi:hypothetical protein
MKRIVNKKAEKKAATKKLVVDQLTLMKLLRFNAERQAAANANALALQSRATLLAKLDPEGVLTKAETEAREAATRFADAEAKILSILKGIEAAFGIDTKQYSINDETGELTRVESN